MGKRTKKILTRSKLVKKYLTAKESIVTSGYAAEIDWQEDVRFERITESDFLTEYAWVVLSGGMRETVIRGLFPSISKAFLNWKSGSEITRARTRCRNSALRTFNHPGKIDSILSVANIIHSRGYGPLKEDISRDGISYIQTFPFMGPATSFHFAKNIGLQVVKPDRHLVRITSSAGYASPTDLCTEIAECVGDALSVVDLVLWRFATLNPGYRNFFSPTSA